MVNGNIWTGSNGSRDVCLECLLGKLECPTGTLVQSYAGQVMSKQLKQPREKRRPKRLGLADANAPLNTGEGEGDAAMLQ